MHPLELTEIVIEVVQYLSLQDQARCARVAKGWLQSFSPFVWFDVHIDDSKPLPCPEAFIRNGRYIRRLRVDDPHLINVLLSYWSPFSVFNPQQQQLKERGGSMAMAARGSSTADYSNNSTSRNYNSGSSVISSGKDKGKAKVESKYSHLQQHQHQQQQHPTSKLALCVNLTHLHLSCWEYTRRMMHNSKGLLEYEQMMVALASKWAYLIALNPNLCDLSVAFYGQVGSVVLPALVTRLDQSSTTFISSFSSFPTLSHPLPSSSLPSFPSSLDLPVLRSLDLRSYPLGREEIVYILTLCPLLERIRLEESPFPDGEDPPPCHPTPIPTMNHVQRLEFDFRRDPPAAIAIDLIEQCPHLKELRLEVENIYPFRYLPPLLRDRNSSSYSWLDNEEDDSSDEDENEDDDNDNDIDGNSGDDHYNSNNSSSSRGSRGCCPELHTLELEVFCEWVSLSTEVEASALVTATQKTCRHLTLRGCTLRATVPERLLGNSQWTHRLVTLDVIHTKNTQVLVAGVLENCPNLEVLRASILNMSYVVSLSEDRDPCLHGRPWVCLRLREWCVAIAGFGQPHLTQMWQGGLGHHGDGDDDDDDDFMDGEDADIEGDEATEVFNMNVAPTHSTGATTTHGNGSGSVSSDEEVVTSTGQNEHGEDNHMHLGNSSSTAIRRNVRNGYTGETTEAMDVDTEMMFDNVMEAMMSAEEEEADEIVPSHQERLQHADTGTYSPVSEDNVFHVSGNGADSNDHQMMVETNGVGEEEPMQGDMDASHSETNLPQSREEERADKIEQVIMQQLGRLQQLEILRIGGCSSLDDVHDEVLKSTSYSLSSRAGLEHLAGLKRLRVFGAYGVHHRVPWQSLEWMVQQWPRLSRLEILEYENTSTPRPSCSSNSQRCQRILVNIIV